MPWITLEEVKHQCRLEEDDASQDLLLNLYIGAASRAIEQHTDRELLDAPQAEMTDRQLVISDDIKAAGLLMVAHWFNNREAVSDFEKVEVPFAFRYLIGPYTRMPI
ncbi:head-tail connector protein [Aeromonas dhakensis]|uniref:head-tail connector protein n=1 Tax=Aeromonas dhakensis TaxID=196024 RepID=UPI003B9E43A0